MEEAATKPPIALNGMDDDTDDLVFPPICEEDLEVIKRVGMTNLALNKNEAIRIVSQDRDTVTVQLQQACDFPAPSKFLHENDPAFLVASPWIDYIYYAYRPDNFDEVCFEETKVEDETVYAKDLTIQCAVTQPYGLLEICMADDIRNERLQFNSLEENGVVPKCCHPSFPPETPVVCYNVKIKCVSDCAVVDDDEVEEEENENKDNIWGEIMETTTRRRRTLLRGSK